MTTVPTLTKRRRIRIKGQQQPLLLRQRIKKLTGLSSNLTKKKTTKPTKSMKTIKLLGLSIHRVKLLLQPRAKVMTRTLKLTNVSIRYSTYFARCS